LNLNLLSVVEYDIYYGQVLNNQKKLKSHPMRKIISFISLKSTIKKSQYNQLIIIYAMLSIKDRITMLGLSRWSDIGWQYCKFYTKF